MLSRVLAAVIMGVQLNRIRCVMSDLNSVQKGSCRLRASTMPWHRPRGAAAEGLVLAHVCKFYQSGRKTDMECRRYRSVQASPVKIEQDAVSPEGVLQKSASSIAKEGVALQSEEVQPWSAVQSCRPFQLVAQPQPSEVHLHSIIWMPVLQRICLLHLGRAGRTLQHCDTP